MSFRTLSGQILFAAVLMIFSYPALAQAPAARSSSVEHEAIPLTARIQPAALAKMIRAHHAPPILQVGFRTLYEQGHIQHAIYAGPARTSEGREQLKKAAARFNHHELLVIYCGCCPWPHCPNVRPAYAMLHKLGFTNLKVLYIPHNFGTDWVMHGYPTVKGS